ncbi:MAG: sialidase family protein, partial [Gemmatimonadota bacterium]|nr:sialidase family protein [Gemmatimonadota bacterium]
MLDDAGWGPALTVASSTEERGFFVNWADFASVEILEPDLLVAHWLVRGPDGGYDYGIRVAQSTDGGLTWTEPLRPHTDETRTEHGFVSKFPLNDGGTGLVWLDARNSVDMDGQKGTPGAMALRYRSLDPDGVLGLESDLDESVCDCCQTDAAISASGPVVVY